MVGILIHTLMVQDMVEKPRFLVVAGRFRGRSVDVVARSNPKSRRPVENELRVLCAGGSTIDAGVQRSIGIGPVRFAVELDLQRSRWVSETLDPDKPGYPTQKNSRHRHVEFGGVRDGD